MCFILSFCFLLLWCLASLWRFPQKAGQEEEEEEAVGFNERAEQHCAVNVVEIILL